MYEFDLVYRNIFIEMMKYGKVVDLAVCNNLDENLRGSVYVLYDSYKSAERCVKATHERLYNARILYPALVDIESLDDVVCQASKSQSCQSRLELTSEERLSQGPLKIRHRLHLGQTQRVLLSYLRKAERVFGRPGKSAQPGQFS